MFSSARQTRVPPPSGRPPAYSLNRYYRSSLRPVIIGTSVVAAIWALLWGIQSFQNISPDKTHNFGGIVPFDIVLGALYMGVVAIEIFGIFAAVKQSLPLTRLYTFASILALGLVIAAEIINLIVHFNFKKTILNECTTAVTGDLVSDDFGFFGNHNVHNLTAGEAANYCQSAFDHNTFTDIVWLLISILLGLFFVSIAFSYYRQLLDPSSLATRLPRNRNNNVPLQTFGNQYGQQEYGHNPYQPQDYAPPYDNAKLPGYGVDNTADQKGLADEKEGGAGGPSH